MRYTLFHTDGEIAEIMNLESQNPYEEVLARLDFRVECVNEDFIDSDEVKEFRVIDATDESEVCTFLSSWYENACIEALSEIGYQLDVGDWTKKDSHPSNVIHLTF
jgi:hypothetical protein